MTDQSITTEKPVVIAGAGPGGLSLALCLHQHAIPAVVCEAVADLKPLGVGINLLPHSVRVLHDLGLREPLEQFAIQTSELRYVNKFGQHIWSEPRGVAAGYTYPQYSIHRGELQLLLLETVRQRLGQDAVRTGCALESWRDGPDGITVQLRDTAGATNEIEGACLVAADGIHSIARRRLYPGEGPPRYSGRILWRAVTEGYSVPRRSDDDHGRPSAPEVRRLSDLTAARRAGPFSDQLDRRTGRAGLDSAAPGLEPTGAEITLQRPIRELALRLARCPVTDRRPPMPSMSTRWSTATRCHAGPTDG